MEHSELVDRGFRWLKNFRRCPVVAAELVAGMGEVPDVIGWHGACSYVIEAKVSRGDFVVDAKKYFRREPVAGAGIKRYFIVPEELSEYALEHLPDRWGLLICRGRVTGTRRESMNFETDRHKEIMILLSIVRRISITTEPLHWVGVRPYIEIPGTVGSSIYIESPDALEEVAA